MSPNPKAFGKISNICLIFLGSTSLATNQLDHNNPLKIIKRFCNKTRLKIHSLKILVLGLAFKGTPPTNDIRMSQSIKLIKKLKKMKINIKTWDAVLDKHNYREYSFVTYKKLIKEYEKADIVLILNNNDENRKIVSEYLKNSKKPKLIFDGWSILKRDEVMRFKNLCYGDMGSLTLSE